MKFPFSYENLLNKTKVSPQIFIESYYAENFKIK